MHLKSACFKQFTELTLSITGLYTNEMYCCGGNLSFIPRSIIGGSQKLCIHGAQAKTTLLPLGLHGEALIAASLL